MLQCLTFAESHLEVHQIILTGNFWEKGGGAPESVSDLISDRHRSNHLSM